MTKADALKLFEALIDSLYKKGSVGVTPESCEKLTEALKVLSKEDKK